MSSSRAVWIDKGETMKTDIELVVEQLLSRELPSFVTWVEAEAGAVQDALRDHPCELSTLSRDGKTVYEVYLVSA